MVTIVLGVLLESVPNIFYYGNGTKRPLCKGYFYGSIIYLERSVEAIPKELLLHIKIRVKKAPTQ